MLAQYVYPSLLGLFRIVRHGRRWRALCEHEEVGRFDCELGALAALREAYPHARLPARLERWRFLPQLALVHARASNEDAVHWPMQA